VPAIISVSWENGMAFVRKFLPSLARHKTQISTSSVFKSHFSIQDVTSVQ
jgi:hypothetical protein